MSPSTGIILNNLLDGFSYPDTPNKWGMSPSPLNLLRPGKRPVSSMAPSILVDKGTGKVRLVIGSKGGPKITTSIAYVRAAMKNKFPRLF